MLKMTFNGLVMDSANILLIFFAEVLSRSAAREANEFTILDIKYRFTFGE